MSSIEERQREEKEERRRTILDAAETVLAEKGRDDMTMADIADEARLSRSLLYVYFEEMDDIVLGVTHRGLRSMRKRFEAAVAQRETGLQQIHGIGEAYVRFSQEAPTYFNLVAQFESRAPEPDEATPRMKKCLTESERSQDVMQDAIQNGIDDGSIRPELDPARTAITLWGCTHGLIQIAANKGKGLKQRYDWDPETFVDDGLDFLGLGLAGRPLDEAPEDSTSQ